MFGVSRCHARQDFCVVDNSGTEVPSGSSICIDEQHTRSCVQGLWAESSGKTCARGCSNGWCVEDLHPDDTVLAFPQAGLYDVGIPVSATSYRLNDLFPNVPVGSQVSVLRNKAYATSTFDDIDSVWAPELTLNPGEGFRFSLLAPYRVTLQGTPVD